MLPRRRCERAVEQQDAADEPRLEWRLAADLGVRRTTEVRAVGTIAFAVLQFGCVGPFSDDFEARYPTLAAARQSYAIGDHRWIPDIVPETASDIVEFHNIDTNATWGCFRLNGGADPLVSLLRAKAARESKGAVSGGPRPWFRTRPWWPETMTKGIVDVFEFTEPAAAPALDPTTVRVGLDRAADTACFRRRR
jgi:hypothetical protein